MYKEVSKSKFNSVVVLFVTIVMIVAVMTVSNSFVYPHNKLAGDGINMIFFGLAVYYFMRWQVNAFEYRIENNTFNVTRLGNKNNPQLLLSVSMLDIENFGLHTKEKCNSHSVLNYCGTPQKSNRYSFNVTVNEKSYTVVFQPSQKLVKMIEEVMV